MMTTRTHGATAVHPLLSDSAKYVPYTPRQRPATSGAAKPQLASLRATAQAIGLDANSTGWAILDKIAHEGDVSEDWADIWHALTKARATLVLPAGAHDLVITPDVVQDHLAIASREALVTLSGLRGHLVNDTLTFRSSSKSLASPDALAPLPVYPLESSYPTFAVSAFSAALPLPSRATKPPLPPRPGARGAQPARLMPFASLFGQRPSTPPPPTAATATTAPPPPIDTDPVIDISALVIDAAIIRTDIATSIISALKGEIAIALNDQPPWLVERVHTFCLPYLPFVKLPAGKKKLQDIGGNPNRVVYAVNGALDEPEGLADKFQSFYRAVERELRDGHRVDENTNGPRDSEADETRIREVLETIESTLCTLLYDRLFMPSTSDDASHNEALSSRIAALNMLDLGLEHLDVDVGNANHAEVDAVVRACGQALAQLDSTARSPREKAAVLVSAHKLVVEGLSTISPVRLKSRDNDKGHPHDSTEHTRPIASIRISEPTEEQSPSVPLSTSPDQPSPAKPSSETVPPSTSTPVSGDVLLPILIFSVVKANPLRLVSHLLFTQRFRNQSFGGEESYCLINLMAVAEFLENVDLGALGLGESEKKVLSTADLTPIPIARNPESPIAATLPGEGYPPSLRGRVGQGVDTIAGSANKVILGVVDSSFGVLRALLPGQTGPAGISGSAASAGQQPVVVSVTPAPGTAHSGVHAGSSSGTTAVENDPSATWGVRPSLGLLRRETGFSIAGLTAALPGGHGRTRSQSHPEMMGQRELVEVTSRPPSLKSHPSGRDDEGLGETEEGSSEEEAGVEGSEDESAEEGREDRKADGEGDVGEEEEEEEVHDTRSIKSFESMLSSARTKRKTNTATPSKGRKRLTDLTDRLAHGMAGMSRRVQGGDAAHRATTWTGRGLPPPNRRFVECAEQDIRVSEVGELLREYQRLVEAVRNAGGWQE